MRKYLFSGLIGIILLVIAACGGDDPSVAPTTAPTVAPTEATTGGTTKSGTTTSGTTTSGTTTSGTTTGESLQDYAAKMAGGPGAIYLGDISQLVGPAPSKGEGDADGNVPLASLKSHNYVYESDYYKSLIEKANLTNPTKLVSEGLDISIQHACVNRALGFCKIVESYFGPNLSERTNGQLNIVPSSFPELGIAGPDTLALVEDGTLDMVSILGVYVAGELPGLEIQFLFGLYTSREDQYNATTNLAPDLEKLVVEASGGGKLINFNWHSGDDIFLFTNRALRSSEDLVGLKVRSFGTAIADWIKGMGADAQFMAFSEVYTALERGVIDAGVTGGDAGHGQRWYEVTDYINGPLIAWPSSLNIMNEKIWNGIPEDLQQIMIEEGAKSELEALRIGSIQNELGLEKNLLAGMEFVEFNDEMRALSDRSVMESVVPNWVDRVGGPEQDIVRVFNEKIGTIIGLKIEADGAIVRTGSAIAMTPTVSAALQAYADAHAGGPGSIFVGDYNQLVGDAPGPGLGGFDDEVSLESLTQHKWIYESDYYNSLPAKAKLTNPTELVSEGETIKFQHACINRTLLWCKLMEAYLVPNLLERTNGQVEMQISSFPELGLSGTDTMSLVSEGTLGASEIYGGYVGGEYPALEVQYLWGLWPTHETHYNVLTSIFPDLEQVIVEATGAVVVSHNWIPGDDQFFFSDHKLTTLEDFKGLKTRSHSAALSDWIEGMGADAQFVAFSEVYTALERGILDAGVTGASPGFSQRWYEVTDYMNGRLISFNSTTNVINGDVWAKIPADLQAIILEEGAKYELEALRIAGIQNLMGVARNVDAGRELVEFSEELSAHSFNVAALQHVVPAWINRVGGADHPAVKIFNKKIGPLVGVHIETDGSVTNTKTGSSQASISARLQAYADAHAGGPGAIYVGDINQLAGPAITKDQGDFDGMVPLASLEENLFIYESDYYKELLKTANIANPTKLVSTGLDITIQNVCINRALLFCELTHEFTHPNVLERTNGQLKLVSASFPELGIAGPDSITLVEDGTLDMALMVPAYVGGELPGMDIIYMWNLYPDRETQFNVFFALAPDIEQMLEEETGGGTVIYRSWGAGIDVYVWSKKALNTPDDYKGLKIRTPGTAFSDFAEGMGASAQFIAFAEVYTGLERGILDGAISGANAGYGQRWYEVTDYITGPLLNMEAFNVIMGKKTWDKLPPDFQQILIEEGAKDELEALRHTGVQNDMGLLVNTAAGSVFTPFSPEVTAAVNKATIERVVPNWVKRSGGGDMPIIKIFNEKVGPRIGLHIELDGSLTKVPITITDE